MPQEVGRHACGSLTYRLEVIGEKVRTKIVNGKKGPVRMFVTETRCSRCNQVVSRLELIQSETLAFRKQ